MKNKTNLKRFLFLVFLFGFGLVIYSFWNPPKNFCKNCKIYTGCNQIQVDVDTIKILEDKRILPQDMKLYTKAKINCDEGVVKVKSLSIITGEISFSPINEFRQFIKVTYSNEEPLKIFYHEHQPEGPDGLYKVFFKPPYIFFQIDDNLFFDMSCKKYNIERRVLENISSEYCD